MRSTSRNFYLESIAVADLLSIYGKLGFGDHDLRDIRKMSKIIMRCLLNSSFNVPWVLKF